MSLIASDPAVPGPTRPWPADRVERWPIERLIPYANNPRLHSEADLVALERYGIRVAERVPHVFPSNGYNERYLCTKATRSGHFL
jgi:GTP cyclohydrolase II